MKANGWMLVMVLLAVGAATLRAQDEQITGTQAPQWPMHLSTADAQITVYQPQLIKFDGNQLTGRAAVAVFKPGVQEPVFGAIWLNSRVATDRSARLVHVLDIKVTRVRFPDGGPTADVIAGALNAATLAQGPMTLSLDQLLAMLQVVQKEKEATAALSDVPPAIIFRDHAAVLVQFDAQPLLQAVPNSNLMRAVNTPFFVVLDPGTKTYFLKGAGQWFAASTALGPYQGIVAAPAAVADLATSSGYQDPQQAANEGPAVGVEIVTATDPTELLWTDGEPQMSPIADTNLLYVTNTSSDVFLLIDTQELYVLASGRWFMAASRNGPWTYVTPDKLPADFARIPLGSAKADVLAHVAGTQEAKDAVADTFVPQTAALDRQNFQQPPVQYDGQPNFEAIADTSCSYAVNSPESVVQTGGSYYCCYDAAWYSSANPAGPWALCTSVPPAIYTIGPSCPVYPCTFVSCYDSTPDLVYVGYLPGYLGCYHRHGVVVFGTGYRYHAWTGHEYFARPLTFGFGAHYDAYHGHWGFSIGLGEATAEFWLGNHAQAQHGAGPWFGHGGFRPTYERTVVDVRNHTVGVARGEVNEEHVNVYARRKDVHPEGVRVAQPGARGSTHGPEVRQQAPPRDEPRNSILSDDNGNVYRKTIDGWQQRQNTHWAEPTAPAEHHEAPPAEARHEAPAAPPPRTAPEPRREAPPPELNQEYHARVAGDQRADDYHQPAPRAPAPSAPSRGGGGGEPRGNSRH